MPTKANVGAHRSGECCRHEKNLTEEFIGAELYKEGMKDVTDASSELGRRMLVWQHQLADLYLDLRQRQLEASDSPAAVVVPATVDEALLQKLEQEGDLYHTPLEQS